MTANRRLVNAHFRDTENFINPARVRRESARSGSPNGSNRSGPWRKEKPARRTELAAADF